MHKDKRAAKKIGLDAFKDYYRNITNSAVEYDKFLLSLTEQNTPCVLVNPLYRNELESCWRERNLSIEPISWFPWAIQWPQELEFPSTLPGYQDYWFYLLNPSSLLPVLALEIAQGDIVLDACAAPGGKTMATLWSSELNNITLVANELSSKRYSRLKSEMVSYGLSDIEITNFPAEIIGKKAPDIFDKILLDAPCSSEKHVIKNQKVLDTWSPKRISKLVSRQNRLLKSLIHALKIGGTLVYATCALNTSENEELVAKLLAYFKGKVELRNLSHLPAIGSSGLNSGIENALDLHKVVRVMPHVHRGYDPMFIASFKRIH